MDFETANELKIDTLELAGEPSDGSSSYDARVWKLLNHVQDGLLSGMKLGRAKVRSTDWWWARAFPRGVLPLTPPVNLSRGGTLTVTEGSRSVSLSNFFVAENLADYRLRLDTTPDVQPYIVRNDGLGAFELRTPWPLATQTTEAWIAYRAEYDLPDDFLRFASPLFGPWPYRVDVVDPRQLEAARPFALIGQGMPDLAALVAERKLRLSHYPGEGTQFEFEYIRRAPRLAAGTTPIMPAQHRRLLSYGAAILLTITKHDSTSGELYDLWTAGWKAMADEQRAQLRNGSSRFGVVSPRGFDAPTALRTESGLRVY